MSRHNRSYARSAYGATITAIAPTDTGEFRVHFTDSLGMGNGLMRPEVNADDVKVGDVADVVRSGNGRILGLFRSEDR